MIKVLLLKPQNTHLHKNKSLTFRNQEVLPLKNKSQAFQILNLSQTKKVRCPLTGRLREHLWGGATNSVPYGQKNASIFEKMVP